MHEAYRSLPGTPVGIDPRGAGTMGFDVGDYFSNNPRFGPGAMRPRSPFPIDYEHENGLARNRSYGPDQESWKEEIWRRDNKLACLLNGAIPPYAKYALVHPMKGKDGEYPVDFRHPKTVDTMRVLDNSQLDRIMQAYCLPLDLRPINPSIYGQWIGVICILLCLAVGIANLFHLDIIILFGIICIISGLILIFVEVPLLLRICPTSSTFDTFIRRFTTNYMRAAIYGVMSLIQWLSIIRYATSLIAAAVLLLLAAVCYALAGLKGQGFVGSKTLGGQGVAQMIV
ncbi:MAG: hypothetical protein LQ342_000046 [Letrouitia transgressa]|nr:MAG: hypothetical protein LQ342_000046 [Letrouitia transgressa]